MCPKVGEPVPVLDLRVGQVYGTTTMCPIHSFDGTLLLCPMLVSHT